MNRITVAAFLALFQTGWNALAQKIPATSEAVASLAPPPSVIQTETDMHSIMALMNEIGASPVNPKPRELLRALVLQKLREQEEDLHRKRAAALAQGLKSAYQTEASSVTIQKLAQSLQSLDPKLAQSIVKTAENLTQAKKAAETKGEASLAEDLFLKMLLEAVAHHAQGKQDQSLAILISALALQSADSAALQGFLQTLKAKAKPAAKPAAALRPHNTAQITLRKLPPEIDTADAPAAEIALEHFRVGIRFYSNSQLEQAAGAFRESLKLDPENKWAKNSLERTLRELEALEKEQSPLKAQPEAPQKSEEAKISETPEGAAGKSAEIAMPKPPGPLPPKPKGPYITQQGDTLWSLARTFYGDPTQWRVILEANPGLDTQYAIPAGTSIVIPSAVSEAEKGSEAGP